MSTGAVMTNRALLFLQALSDKKYIVVRGVTGAFALYFFSFYIYSFDYFFIFREKSEPNLINSFLALWPDEVTKTIIKSLLVIFILGAVLFTLGIKTRLSALIVWIGYTLCYNFYLCINQPHISYFLYIVISYVFLSSEYFWRRGGDKKFGYPKMLWIPSTVYMLQITVSGFSKALSPEWQNGTVLSLLSQIYDPDPGVRFIGSWPPYILKGVTWLVLLLECASIIYLFIPKMRFPIWLSHIFMYLSICILIPHAKHVAFVMILFNILILDRKMLPK